MSRHPEVRAVASLEGDGPPSFEARREERLAPQDDGNEED